MEVLKYFFECWFNESEDFKDLDNIIKEFKKSEREDTQLQLMRELHQIIHTHNYDFASHFINEYGRRILDREQTEKFINFLYDKLIDVPTEIKPEDDVDVL